MAITVLPQQKNALDYMEPYLQLAFQTMMERKLDEKQFERDKELKLLQPPFPKIPQNITGMGVGTRQKGFGTQFSGVSGEGKPTFKADTPQDIFERTTQIRKEFIDRPEVKDYVAIKTQVGAMDSLLQHATNGAPNVNNPLDQALIMTYNKILDPTSVVRESEYARTPENLSTVNRIQGAIEKFSEGGAGLTADDRQALVLGAKIIADERGNRFNEALKGYQKVSTSAAVVPQDVIRGFRPHKKFQKEETRKEEKSNLKIGEQFMGKKVIAIEPYTGD